MRPPRLSSASGESVGDWSALMSRLPLARMRPAVVQRGHLRERQLAGALKPSSRVVDVARGDIGTRGAQYQPAIAVVQAAYQQIDCCPLLSVPGRCYRASRP